MERKPIEQLEARRLGLWTRLRSYPPEVHGLLPVKMDEVQKKIDSLDELAIASQFENQLGAALLGIKDPASFAAVKYEWYYGGSPDDAFAEGFAVKVCPLSGYSRTDLVKLGDDLSLERQEPELAGDEIEIGGFGVGPVMSGWYADLAPRFQNFNYEEILNTPAHRDFNEAQYIFNELFRLKLFKLLNRAYMNLKSGRPRLFYIGTHERWPVLVAD